MVRKARGNETIDLTLSVIHETDAAWLVTDSDENARIKRERWIPKSQCEKGRRVAAGIYEFTVPEWLAVEKGFV